MAVDIYCSPDLDQLIHKLVEVGESKRLEGGGGLIARWTRPITIVVPGLEFGTYVQQAVSRSSGVAINYEFLTLEKFLGARIEEAAGDRFELLDREVMKTLLLDAFIDLDGLPEDAQAPILNYLESGGDIALEKRRYQLARKVATIFEEYIFSRFDMLEAWENSELFFADREPRVAAMERWQAALWCRLMEHKNYKPLPRAFAAVSQNVSATLADATGGAVHVFGFAGFGAEYMKMLQSLGADKLAIHFYFCSPTSRELEYLNADTMDVHRALRLWAKVGRDTLSELSEYSENGVEKFRRLKPLARSRKSTNLGQLQRAIDTGYDSEHKLRPLLDCVHKNDQDDDGNKDKKDKKYASLSFLQCPGLRREVEVVANEIWKQMGQNPELRFSDIAVVIPQGKSETYLAHLESVFADYEKLPYKINGLSLRGRSALMDAVELLLGLPFGAFGRQELLSLLVHPNFASRYPDIDEETWIDWVQKLNIFYGADRAHQTRRGSYLTSDLFNWDQGMKRLAMGAFLQVDDGPEDARVQVGEHRYLPEEQSLSEMEAASAINAAVTSLIDDARWLRDEDSSAKEGRTMEEWSEILAAMVETYLVASTTDDGDYEEDIKTLYRIVETFRELANLPEIKPVSYQTAYLYALDRLSALSVPVGQRLTGGVIVSTPQRLRALSFEHVFVLGAAEGEFPAQDPNTELDLRLEATRRGDISPSERDKYHFLEILQATRTSLAVSWVGRESSTGEELPPSSIVSDLRRMVGENPKEPELTVVHPLRRYDATAYDFPGLATDGEKLARPNYHRESFEEARMQALREVCVGEDIRKGRNIWTGETFREIQDRIAEFRDKKDKPKSKGEPKFSKREKFFGLHMIVPGSGEKDRYLPDTISISKLASFLKTPLQTKAKVANRIYDEDEEAEERESFSLGNLEKSILISGAFEQIFEDPKELQNEQVAEAAIRAAAQEYYRADDLPVEVFNDAAINLLVEDITQIGFNLIVLFTKHYELDLDNDIYRWEVAAHPEEDGQLPAPYFEFLNNDGEGQKIHLIGKMPVYLGRNNTFLSVISSTRVKKKHHLKAYISHLILSTIGGEYENISRSSIVVPTYKKWTKGTGKSTIQKKIVEFLAVSSTNAKQCLKRLIGDLYIDKNFELFPVEVVEAVNNDDLDYGQTWNYTLQEDNPGDYGGISTQYGPIKDYLNYPPPKDPMAVIGERFKYQGKMGAVDAHKEGQ